MLLLTMLFVVLCGVAILFQEMIVMPSFVELEQRNAQIAMNRVRTSLENDKETFAVQVMDWANWGELHEFVRGKLPEWGLRNVTSDAMGVIQADAIWITDLEGRVLLSSDKFVHTGFSLDGIISHGDALRADLPWRGNLGSMTRASGLVNTEKGLMIVVSGPILDGSGSPPSVGMALMGRLVTPAMLRRIEMQTDTVVAPQIHLEDGIADRLVETSGVTQVFGSFRDIYGQPVLTLRVDVPRDFTAYGRRALQIASASIVAAAVAVLIVMLLLLNRLVLAPLTRVTRHAVAIGKDPDLLARLDFNSADEFGLLADEFDGMVERLSATRKELVDQSFEAGFAEMSKGVLHNLGNALTPLGVRLDALSRRLRESPADDVRQAAAELASAEGDADRKAQLLELIDLGAREMAAMVTETSKDLETMQRQASLMRASLSEQMQFSRSRAPLLESVKLPELVAQSLDIVPDVSRRRLSIEADESLQKIGAVRVARTVLRMVLQNLIINAADAVRDSGKDKGVFRVAAEIVSEPDGQQLHLRCEDDGVGIPPDQLERVFEKGFSTKSSDSNHGIGLHWCANAVIALGGRIWAASDGPGCGASMHLMLPIGARESGGVA